MEGALDQLGVVGRLWQWLLQAVFPRFCIACGASGGLICADCAARVPLATITTDDVTSLFSYREPLVRTAIQAHKYHGDMSGVRALLRRSDVQDALTRIVATEDVIVPLPLHHLRERARGFNQAADIAREVCKSSDHTVVFALSRRTNAGQLAGKSKEERLAVMAERPFVVTNDALVRGKNVVIVDDVRTTGATLQAAMLALREAGAASVTGLTLAAADESTDI